MGKAFCLFILAFLLLIYRQAIFGEKIVFPSNYLASFYSPWSAQKFTSWDQGIPNKPIGGDQLRFFYPQKTFTNQESANWNFPLWNPNIFSGNPHLANFQSAIFYPLNVFYFFLPQLVAWSILIFAQPLLAAIFCYLLLEALKLKKLAVALGAFAFGFSGYIITWSQEAMTLGHSVIWLPLALFGIEKKKYWLTIAALTFSILAGYLQTTIYTSLFIIVYALFRKVSLVKTIIICLLAISLSAIQIVPTLESFSLSARPTATIETVFNTYLLPLSHLVKLIAPDINGNPGSGNYFGVGSYNETSLYIGLPSLILAVYAVTRKRGNPFVKFFALATSLTFLLTSNFPLTRWFLHLPLPLIPTFQPSRILILTTFSLSVLSAFGLSAWLEEKKKSGRTIFITCLLLAGAVGLMLIWIKFNFLPRDFLVAVKNSLLPLGVLGVLGVLVAKPLQKLFVPAVLFFTIIGQFYFFNKYLVLGDKNFLYPNVPVWQYLKKVSSPTDRFLAFGQPILGDFSIQYKLATPEGYDPIYSKRYGQLIFAARDFMQGKLTQDLPRIEIIMSQLRATASGELIEPMTENYRRLRLLSLLGIKNILYSNTPSLLSPPEMFPSALFNPVAVIGNWQAYEYKDALPRAFLVGNYLMEKDPQKILDKIFDPNLDLQETLILEKNLSLNISPSLGFAKIISYQPNKVTIQASTKTPQLLFLSDNYYPGWEATIDGQPSEIFITNYSFRSVLVPPGTHEIIFNYDPWSFKIGAGITLLTIVLLAGGKLLSAQNPNWADKFWRKQEQ